MQFVKIVLLSFMTGFAAISAYFNFYIDSSVNISVISIIAQALFPEIYSIFEFMLENLQEFLK